MKRLAEIFAVLALTAGLMAGGAALYSWLRPQEAGNSREGSEQGADPTTKLTPLLTEPIVFALVQDFLETPSLDFLTKTTIDQRDNLASCFQKGLKAVRYREGAWTIRLAGIGCKGLEIFTVDDLTGQVIPQSPALIAFTSLTPTPVAPTAESPPTAESAATADSPPTPESTSTSEPAATPETAPTPVLAVNPGLPLTPGPALNPRATPNPEYAKVVRFIELYLAKSRELNVSCINTAIIEARKGFLPSAATTGIYWSVKAESDYEAQTTWGCPQFHFYEVDDFTGDVRRTRGK